MKAVVIGASGAIGGALAAGLAARDDVSVVHTLSRSGCISGHPKFRAGAIDITDEASIEAAAAQVAALGAPQLVLIATGILSDGTNLQPEKSYRQINLEALERVFAINTFAPALVAKHFLPIMPRSGRAVLGVLSARVGSISDNRLGGWHAYRASKTALNMLVRNLAIEQARRNSDFIIASLHPGTVASPLSAPFQGNVAEGKLFTPDQSAAYLLKVIDGLKPEDSGKVFDWAGTEIPS